MLVNSTDPDEMLPLCGISSGSSLFAKVSRMKRVNIFAHQIRISEILPWDRKSYLTHAILPRLSRKDYIHWLYWNSRTLPSSEVIVMFKCRHHVKFHISLFRDFWKLIFK